MRSLIVPLLVSLYSFSACAGSGPGLAMTGTPLLPVEATHLGYANPDAPKGGTLRLSVTGSFDTLNPLSIKGKAAQGLNYTTDRLMGRSWDEPFTLYPLIAERAEMPEDRSSITFFLNSRARFQDGTPITIDDVIFSFETLREKGRPNMRQVYKLVAKVEKTGSNGVTFTLGPGYDRETVMILAMMPVLSRAYWADKEFDKTTLTPPISSGPYKIAKVDPGRKLVLERDPSYWAADLPINKGLYNFDRIDYDYYRDDSVAFEAFKAGYTDIRVEMDPGRWTSGYNFPAKTAGKVRQEDIAHGRVERMWGFIYNTRRAPFDDIRVRKALGLMVDYSWINQNIFHSQYKPLTSFYANSSLAAAGSPSPDELALLEPFRDKLPPEVFGPAWEPSPSGTAATARASQKQADALLRSADWIVRDGKRVHAKSGRPMRFEIVLGAAEDEKVGLAFKRALGRLGIDVSLRTLDTAAFRDRLNGYEYDMVLYFWTNTLSPGTEQALYWGCAAAKQEGRFNYAGFCSPAGEALTRAIPQAKTREELTATVRALDRVLTWSHIAIPLFYSGRDLVASHSDFRHPQKTALYGNTLESWWYAPAKTQPKQSFKRD